MTDEETATQALHRLTSYEPGREWDVPIEGPRVVADLAVTGVPWRTGWRYRERWFQHIYWDAGTMLVQLLAVADSAGLTVELYTGFPDAAVTELVGADGVHE